jgi:plasminogen activator inhibitor 1 RNA-binding protein
MSYDEYLAMKARPDSEAFKPLEARKVENEFVGKAPTKKETEDFLVMGGGKQPRKKGSAKKDPEKLMLDFKIKSAITNDREGGQRRNGGGRDGGRGGGRREGGERRDGRGGRGGRGGGDRGDRGDRGGHRKRGGRGGVGGGGGGGGLGSKGLDTSDASSFPSL